MKNRESTAAVFIAEAGPGLPGLLTMRTWELLGQVDTIVCFGPPNARLLATVTPSAKFVSVEENDPSLASLCRILQEKTRKGERILVIKQDRFCFSREFFQTLDTLKRAGVEFEFIPGVQPEAAIPALAGIPLGRTAPRAPMLLAADSSSASVLRELIKNGGTAVFDSLGRKPAGRIRELLDGGLPDSIPAAVVLDGALFSQRTLAAPLGALEGKLMAIGDFTTCTLIVGDEARVWEPLAWFDKRPLFGLRVLVTRSRDQARPFVKKLEDLGAEVVLFPTIKIVPPESFAGLDRAIGNLSRFSWIIFTSVNGVQAFCDRMTAAGLDWRAIKEARLCAIGPKTAQALRAYGLQVDLVPEIYQAEGILEAFAKENVRGLQVLLARAQEARPDLVQVLRQRGVYVDEVVAYRTVPDKENAREILQMLKESKIHILTFTSSSTVMNFAKAMGDAFPECVGNAEVVCIGPVTAQTARDLGLSVQLVPDSFTTDSMIDVLIRNYPRSRTERRTTHVH
ncbi:MAG: uroporphyrinogen-III synthase [Armatimonadetes bacterium]|nr:uroporphyrinogen-III synthase [Armatimonadota bacterium]